MTLAGYHSVRRDIDVGKDKTVALELELTPSDRPLPGAKKGPLPYVVLVGGLALAGAGVTLYLMDQDCERDGPCELLLHRLFDQSGQPTKVKACVGTFEPELGIIRIASRCLIERSKQGFRFRHGTDGVTGDRRAPRDGESQ